MAEDDLTVAVRDIKSDLAIAVRDLKIWTGSIAAGSIAILFGALHIWPPR